MRTRRAVTVSLVLVAVGTGTGCGDDEQPTSSGAGEDSVVLTFTKDGLTAQTPLRIESGARIGLSIRSLDGRPHGLTVENAPRRPRVVVLPGKTNTIDLGVLPDGRYRLAPDGAQDPLTLVVG